MFDRFCDIVFRLPVAQSFTYLIPPELAGQAQRGMRALASLRGVEEQGVILAVHGNPPLQKALPLLSLVDEEAVLTDTQIELAEWMAERYLAAPGECLARMAPARRAYRPAIGNEERGSARFDLELNEEQSGAFARIAVDLDRAIQGAAPAEPPVHLLHGITGSGKTEVYMRLIARALQSGRGAVLLVPEISLTVQLILRLRKVFGRELALLHSALGATERYSAYLDALHGRKRIALGARSAVFVPVHRPALWIIDEEHDQSFKERQAPRYDARQIALERARREGGVVVLGSATPRIESAYHARASDAFRFVYHRLQRRATGAALPTVELVPAPPPDIPLSGAMIDAIDRCLKKKEQSLLLLNRRGYNPYVYCRTCARVEPCPNCSVALTLHRDHRLLCHYCAFTRRFEGRCSQCGGTAETLGSGTQRLEERLVELFPAARIERLDQDAVSRKRVLQQTIARLLAGELDILVGTQMIAKGLDAPGVTLVGVLQADAGLNLPDFRAAERTFALLTQVAGRAGRGERPGRAIFECLNPEHPVVAQAARQDYEAFYRAEVVARKDALYPPFCRLLRVLARSEQAEAAESYLLGLRDRLLVETSNQSGATFILGPAPAPIEKIQAEYRSHLIIKTRQPRQVRVVLARLLEQRPPAAVRVEVDADPVDLL